MGAVIPPLRDVIKALGAISKSLGAVYKPFGAISKPLGAITKPLRAFSKPLGAVSKPLDAITKPLDAITKPIDAITKPLGAISKALGAVSKALGDGVLRRIAGRLRFIATFLAASASGALNRNPPLPLGAVIPPPIIGRRVLGPGSGARSGARAVGRSYKIVGRPPERDPDEGMPYRHGASIAPSGAGDGQWAASSNSDWEIA
ncbi:MAG: hypothetical protein ACTHLZ_19635 [Tepidisphaeraceae bacterium]